MGKRRAFQLRTQPHGAQPFLGAIGIDESLGLLPIDRCRDFAG
jgi:hypothetical protein